MENVSVSIIMATYNRAHYISEALESIQKQTYKNWECIIIDDGGTDDTSQVISKILECDSRFKFLKRPDNYKKGLPGCRNYGLDLAKGNYIIFFDDDDIVHPQNLELCIQGVKTDNYAFCHYKKQSFGDVIPTFKTQILSIDKCLNRKSIAELVTQKVGIASCTVLWSVNCFDNLRFNEDLKYAEEWECYCRILLNGHEGVMLHNILYYNKKHIESNTGEFWGGSEMRLQSKKQAAILMTKNLVEAQYMTPGLMKYLSGLAIGYRDYNLLNEMLFIIKPKINVRLFLKLKYYMFQIWKFYKRNEKWMKLKLG